MIRLMMSVGRRLGLTAWMIGLGWGMELHHLGWWYVFLLFCLVTAYLWSEELASIPCSVFIFLLVKA